MTRIALSLFLILYNCSNALAAEKQLIVMAAPRAADPYYKKVYDKILNFQARYAKAIAKHDDVLILVDKKAEQKLSKLVPRSFLKIAPMEDIWMRDFAPVFPDQGLQFRYTKAAQGGSQPIADSVQNTFNLIAKKLGLRPFERSRRFADGGNVVFSKHAAIVTDRFLRDNQMSESQAIKYLRKAFDLNHVAVIPSDDSTLAHADGMVSFIEDRVLLVNTYRGKFRKNLIAKLKASLPKVKIIEVPWKPDTKDWDAKFSSACGINLNALVTDRAIYVPTFGNKIDSEVIKTMKSHSNKAVVPIDAQDVCFMGGSARCLTWQTRRNSSSF